MMSAAQMTHGEIEKIDAGPKLDALVAEKVMDWKRLPNQRLVTNPGFADPLHYHWNDGKGRSYFDLPPFSSDIASAWEVVEKLQSDGYDWMDLTWDGNGWDLEMGQGGHDISCDTYGAILPLVICRAALKAVSA